MRKSRFFIIVVLAVCIFPLFSLSANASEAGCLQVSVEDEVNLDIYLYLAADRDGSLSTEFSDAELNAEDLLDGHQDPEIALLLSDHALRQGLSGTTGTTDSSGVVRFDGLGEGCYLVRCEDDTAFDPFLVRIPTIINGEEIYKINASPKQDTTDPSSPTDPDSPTDPEPNIPQTGTSVFPMYLLLLLGIVLISGGFFQASYGKKHEAQVHIKRGFSVVFAGFIVLSLSMSLFVMEERKDTMAGETSQILLEQLALNQTYREESPLTQDPADKTEVIETSMEVKDYLGFSMVGTLRIPSVDIELPILSSWSYDLLNVAPCVYSGSVFSDDMILLGHNYKSHFTPLHSVERGAKVEFQDVNGKIYKYRVDVIDTLHKSEGEALASDHPLILFTCTAGGQNRKVVRCISEDMYGMK